MIRLPQTFVIRHHRAGTDLPDHFGDGLEAQRRVSPQCRHALVDRVARRAFERERDGLKLFLLAESNCTFGARGTPPGAPDVRGSACSCGISPSMSIFDWLRRGRDAARAIDDANAIERADDEKPIDEVRASDGDVAQGVLHLRAALERAPRGLRRALTFRLAGLLRRLGPEQRLEADGLYRALRAQRPRDQAAHWNHALLLKHSGRFEEALGALEDYRKAGGAQDQAYHWNTGICATGAGQGARALAAWRTQQFKISMGDDGLPLGGFPAAQVRVSSRGPICDPTRMQQENEPGFEYGWVEPRSPCHGVLLTPLLLDEPADVGDLLLWDGAPVRYKEFDGRRVATFPLLKVLRLGGFQRFRFRGEQLEPGLIAALEESLPRGTQLYVHDEQTETLCHQCASSGAAAPHEHEGPPFRRLVAGKLAIPPGVGLEDVRSRLAESLRPRPSIRLAVPGLHRKAGNEAAADHDEKLWKELEPHAHRA